MGAEVLAIVSWCGVEARHMPDYGTKAKCLCSNYLRRIPWE